MNQAKTARNVIPALISKVEVLRWKVIAFRVLRRVAVRVSRVYVYARDSLLCLVL